MTIQAKRVFLKAAAFAALSATSMGAFAQTTIKFQNDWRWEGPSAIFLHPLTKGYFKNNKLDVNIEIGTGSSASVSKVANGGFDMGFADMSSVMEFHANNPDAPNKPVAIMMVYNNTPSTVFALKSSGIKNPSDLNGKRLGAPGFDAGRRTFGLFSKFNGISAPNWTTMDPPLREAMLVRGEVDAITGFGFTSLLNIESKGVNPDDIIAFPFRDYGVKMYGNAIIASPKFLKENPEAVKGFLRAFTQGMVEIVANPSKTIDAIQSKDPKANISLESKRLRLAIDTVINSPDARAEGFGRVNPTRLSTMARQVSSALNTKSMVKVDGVWDGSFLPPNSELDLVLKR